MLVSVSGLKYRVGGVADEAVTTVEVDAAAAITADVGAAIAEARRPGTITEGADTGATEEEEEAEGAAAEEVVAIEEGVIEAVVDAGAVSAGVGVVPDDRGPRTTTGQGLTTGAVIRPQAATETIGGAARRLPGVTLPLLPEDTHRRRREARRADHQDKCLRWDAGDHRGMTDVVDLLATTHRRTEVRLQGECRPGEVAGTTHQPRGTVVVTRGTTHPEDHVPTHLRAEDRQG